MQSSGIGFVGVAVALGVLLVGCDSSASLSTEDQQFVDALVEARVLSADADTDAQQAAVERGREWCDTLSDPETTRKDVARSFAQLLRESELEESQRATVFFGTAARTYCPEAADRLQG